MTNTATNFKVNNFDLLRLFAATEVLFRHCFAHLDIALPSWVVMIGKFPGVPMFFVMSGFLISASFERSNDLKKYFRNRALRIYPALWFCLLLTIVTIYAVSGISFFNREFAPWILSNAAGIIYTPNFLTDFGFGSYNGSLWTIPIELQFYLVLPVTYWLASKIVKGELKTSGIILLAFLFFTVVAYIGSHYFNTGVTENRYQKAFRYSFLPHVYLFFLGVLFQRLKIYNSKLVAGKGAYYLVAFLASQYLLPVTPVTEIFSKLFLGLTTISLAYTSPTLAHKLLRGNDISYGIYIFHGLVLGVVVELGFMHEEKFVYIIWVSSILLAFFSWKFVEKPALNRKRATTPELVQSKIISG